MNSSLYSLKRFTFILLRFFFLCYCAQISFVTQVLTLKRWPSDRDQQMQLWLGCIWPYWQHVLQMACSIEGSLLWHANQIRSRADSLTSIAETNSSVSEPPNLRQLAQISTVAVLWGFSTRSAMRGCCYMYRSSFKTGPQASCYDLFFHHITQHFSTLAKIFMCAACDVCGPLFLQLWKPFCSVRTDLSRVCCFLTEF